MNRKVGSHLRVALACLLAVTVAACIDKGDRHQDPEFSSTSTSSQDPVPDPPVVDNRFLDPVQPGKFLANNCTSWITSTYWPGPNPPSPNPPEWTPSDPNLYSVVMQGLDCGRVSFDGLERGPVQMVLEYTNHLAPPGGCTQVSRTTLNWSLLSWGVSDPELAARLASVLGAPTYMMESQWVSTPIGPGSSEEISWSPVGGESSTIQTHLVGGSEPGGRVPDRFFWKNGTGIIGLDIPYEGTAASVHDQPAIGTLAAPMTLAEPYPVFVAPFAWFPQGSLDATIYSWSDLLCEQPSGSPPPR